MKNEAGQGFDPLPRQKRVVGSDPDALVPIRKADDPFGPVRHSQSGRRGNRGPHHPQSSADIGKAAGQGGHDGLSFLFAVGGWQQMACRLPIGHARTRKAAMRATQGSLQPARDGSVSRRCGIAAPQCLRPAGPALAGAASFTLGQYPRVRST